MRRLSDDGERSARAFVASLGLRTRDVVVADMVATVDGRAAVSGRSVALGHPEDRALLRELRAEADAILVGTGTLAAERYADLLDDEARERRLSEGRPAHPVVATVSRRLRLPVDEAPIFDEAGVPIVAFAEASDELAPPPEVAAQLEVVTLPAPLTLRGVLDGLRRRGVHGVLCEGGPSLLRRLVAEGLLDDLCLTVSPLLAAGDAPAVVEGDGLPDPARLTLRDVHRADDHLFLHYGLTS
ncbi:MAG TPA: dihydrofolate reductase family protein [Baekduia sp.]|uniref:RibD family protein n=1 Tax=Baekduia sp. TaxID=2600305 RepID=UPI002D776942|nr:dihydrofolate reductase family protein [Baekduia sp.]HET6505526.1 dihydrofolate reductase family protein [Baekduia sp.]